jgi:hypothetical protein
MMQYLEIRNIKIKYKFEEEGLALFCYRFYKEFIWLTVKK